MQIKSSNIMAYASLCLLRVLSYVPTCVLTMLGTILGYIGFYLVRSRRNVGLKNLSLCFPQMSDTEKRSIIRRHFCYLVTSALEYSRLFYASFREIQDLVKLNNLEYVMEHYTKRPIILLCPHFVGLDLGAMRLSHEITGYSMYSRQKNSEFTELLKSARLRFIADKGGEIFARQEGLRPIIKRLRQTKLAFYYLPDQDFGERDSEYVPFFAHPTCATVNVLPKLVAMTDAVVVPMVVYKVGQHYEVEFSKAWDNYPSDDLRSDIIRMNQYIESVIRPHIAQYFWLHKRFKTQPGQERGILYKGH